MRLLRANKDRFLFRLSQREKQALLEVLQLYHCVPPAHHRLTRRATTGKDAENQRLLDEALAEQRARNKRQLQALLGNPETFRAAQKGWEFTLRPGDFEWLVQVLNDVRVGSWLLLGAPEELPRELLANAAEAAHACAMELAGLFQMALLEAVEGAAGL